MSCISVANTGDLSIWVVSCIWFRMADKVQQNRDGSGSTSSLNGKELEITPIKDHNVVNDVSKH